MHWPFWRIKEVLFKKKIEVGIYFSALYFNKNSSRIKEVFKILTIERRRTVVDKKDIKEKIKEIYQVLPKLDDQKCGYRTCGEFARAVVEGKAPCYGCVSGGPEVAAKVCEIMGVKVPAKAVPQFGPGSGFYQPGLGGGRGMGRGTGRGMGLGRGMGRGRRRR